MTQLSQMHITPLRESSKGGLLQTPLLCHSRHSYGRGRRKRKLYTVKKMTHPGIKHSSSIKRARTPLPGGDVRRELCRGAVDRHPVSSRLLHSPAPPTAGRLHQDSKAHGCGVGCVDLHGKSLIYYAVPSDCISSAGVLGYRMNPEWITHPFGVPAEGCGGYTSPLPAPRPSHLLVPGLRSVPPIHPIIRSVRSSTRPGIPPATDRQYRQVNLGYAPHQRRSFERSLTWIL